jgi:glycosyltransferase involved in cell wall biosynthesis
VSNARDLGAVLRAADGARDSKNWARASELYQSYLEGAPEHAAIWIQFGHACKETGSVLRALSAYAKAIELAPDESDGYLQYGHALKLAGRVRDAVAAYDRALALDPGNQDAASELARMDGQLLADVARRRGLRSNLSVVSRADAAAGLVYFDISDLIVFLRDNRNVSGIQRVETGLLSSVLSTPAHPLFRRCRFCIERDFSGPELHVLNDALLFQFIRELSLGYLDDDARVHYVNRLTAEAVAQRPRAGDAYFILGAFWIYENVARKLAHINAAGALTGVYIYDLIPITHPEHCVPETTHTFARCLTQIISQVDFAFTISEHVARELRILLAADGLHEVDIAPVVLAHQMSAANTSDETQVVRMSPIVESVLHTDYVLCVATLESRKNHRYLLDVWKRLMNEGVEVPNLVFVGKWGWGIQPLKEHLKVTEMLDGKVLVLDKVSDPELNALYRKAMFTAFPSFVEGWGLPVGESLAHGKFAVSSNSSSLPEVGGDFVRYFDPANTAEGVAVFRDLLENPDQVTRAEERIVAEFQPRYWGEVASELVEAIINRCGGAKRPPLTSLVPLRSGQFAFVGLGSSVHRNCRNVASFVNGLVLGAGWANQLDWGAPTKDRSCELAFLPLCDSGMLHVYFRLIAIEKSAWSLTVTSNGTSVEAPIFHPGRQVVKIAVPYEQGTPLRIALEAGPQVRTFNESEGSLRSAFGIEGIGFFTDGDLQGQMALFGELLTVQGVEIRGPSGRRMQTPQ